MEITTIKLQKKTKSALDQFKQRHETYDLVISRLMSHAHDKKLKTELIKAYQDIGKEDMQILEDWESTSPSW